MVLTYTTTKVLIPHPREKDIEFTGILEHVTPASAGDYNPDRRMALIVHGILGHKDYLYQKRLARRLPFHSFRFDFRGNHESSGESGSLLTDVADLQIIYDYVTKKLGYVVDVIVAHSRGANTSFLWMCTSPDAAGVTRLVSVSSRFAFMKIRDTLNEEQKKMLSETGYYYMKGLVAGKRSVVQIPGSDHEINLAEEAINFPATTHVLTVHGLADLNAPAYEAVLFARTVEARTPGTHNLCFVENADHNFVGCTEVIIGVILEWLAVGDRKELKTGLWHIGLMTKL
ncbi:unnamed protein product [Somion occarium]|uniref:AB hydrolase-1 domain-containing protein n=1 Tax=Somion occarium TaxID=3059160 RepID=A0ABP1E115_9APHY